MLPDQEMSMVKTVFEKYYLSVICIWDRDDSGKESRGEML